jgi:hypothetical protein
LCFWETVHYSLNNNIHVGNQTGVSALLKNPVNKV